MKLDEDKLYTSSVWSLGAFLLASAALLLIVMLANVIGPFRFTALDPSDADRAIGFWIPADGAPPYPPEIAQRTAAWRRFIGSDDIVIESNRLRDLLNAGVGAVILPDARILSADQAGALNRYMMDGGSVIVTGSIGVRDKEQNWLGYEVMRDLLRTESILPLPKDESNVISANRRGPFVAGLGPAERFDVIAEPGVPGLSGLGGELLWTKAEHGNRPHASASARVRLGRGRLAWIGPGPEVIMEDAGEDQHALESALANAMSWTRKRPILEIRPWPNGAAFAVGIDKRVTKEAASLTDSERFALEDAFFASLEQAAKSAEYLQIEIPIRGRGDRWAEGLRIRLVEAISARGGWLATRKEANAWRARHEGLLLSVTQAGPNRMLINVTNRSVSDLAGVELRLWINRPAASISVDQATLGQQMPGVRFDRASESASLDLPEMARGATLTFYVDLDDPDYEDTAIVRSQ